MTKDSPSPRSSQSAFVGRERELAELDVGLDDARSGHGRFFLVTGEPGIGKSRLADELAAHATSKALLVLRAESFEGAGTPPYWPFIQLVRAALIGAYRDDLLKQLSAEYAPRVIQDVAHLVPELRQLAGVPPPVSELPPSDPEQARFRLSESVAIVFKTLASTIPLMLIVEDLHDTDQGSLQMLRFRQLKTTPVLVLGTYRDLEPQRSPTLSQIIGNLAREGTPIPLVGLSREHTAHLIKERTEAPLSPKLVSDIYRATAGNPLFIDGIVRVLSTEGTLDTNSRMDLADFRVPDGVREAIRGWLALISDRSVLVVAATIGKEFELRCLQRVTEISNHQLLDAMREAVGMGVLIRQSHDTYSFSHALIRNALCDELDSAHRAEFHLKIGEALEELYETNLEPHAGELAGHFREAGNLNKAVDYSIRAGEMARLVFAYEEAIALWRAALELMSRCPEDSERQADLLERLGELLGLIAAEGAGHIQYLQQSSTLYEEMGRWEAAGRVHSRLAGWYLARHNPDLSHSLEHARKAQELLSEGAEGPSSAFLQMGLAGTALNQMRYKEAYTASWRAMNLTQRLGDDVHWVRATTAHAAVLSYFGKLEEAFALFREAWIKADQLDDAMAAAGIASLASSTLIWLLDPVEAEAWVKSELAKTRKSSMPYLQKVLFQFLGTSLTLMGKLPEAGGLVARGEGGPLLEGKVTFYQGEWHRAELILARAFDEIRRRGQRLQARDFCDLLVRVHCALGQHSAAEAIVQENLPTYVEAPDLPCQLRVRLELALLYAETGRPEHALPHLVGCREVLAAGEDWRGLAGHVARAEGAVAAAEGRFDTAHTNFSKALEIYRRYQVPFEEAETLHYWGRALLAARDNISAREKLAAAVDLYQRHGAGEAWLERVRSDQLRAKAAGPIAQIAPTLPRVPASRQLQGQGETGEVSYPQGVFHKEGDYWTLSYDGHPEFRLRDAKGLRYVAYLLAHPGQEFAVQDLVSVIEAAGGNPGGTSNRTNQQHQVHTAAGGLGDAGVGLDARSKQEYRHRVAELKEELAVAEQNNDLGLTVKVRQELDFIRDQIAASVGLRGRDRKVASHAERARLMVTKAIKSALQRIRQTDAEMGRHFALSIQTGYFCTYVPRSPTTWQI
jgi:tetratricopeptide (TPR) repeat protein